MMTSAGHVHLCTHKPPIVLRIQQWVIHLKQEQKQALLWTSHPIRSYLLFCFLLFTTLWRILIYLFCVRLFYQSHFILPAPSIAPDQSWFLVFLLETEASWGKGISRNFYPLPFFRATQFWHIKGTSKWSGEEMDLMGRKMAFEDQGGQFSFFLLLIFMFWEVSKGEHLA